MRNSPSQTRQAAESLRVDRSIQGRPRSVPRTTVVEKEAIPDARYGSFPALRTEVAEDSVRRTKRAVSARSWLRIGFYGMLAVLVFVLSSPSVGSFLPESERQLLVSASDVAQVTRSFSVDLSAEKFQKRSHWTGSSSYLYSYQSSDPSQPHVASLLERTDGLARRFSGSSVGALLREFDWRTHSADMRGLVDMEHGVRLGDQSESYFLYEGDRPVGNCITVRIGDSRLSFVLGGVVLMNGKEVERVLGPALEKIRALEGQAAATRTGIDS